MIELRPYQQEISSQAAELLGRYKIAYLAMECRTGKTLTALAAAQIYGVKSVLVLTKKKAIPSIQSDYALLAPSYAMEVINYESVQKCTGSYDLIIMDEAHSLGTYPRPSVRTKCVKKVAKNKPIIYLSGTPSPESYSQLYHQFWVSSFSPFKLFPTFYKWAKSFVRVRQRKINGYDVSDYSDADKSRIDALTKHLFIDYSQEEAGFSADIREHIEMVEMDDWTRRALKIIARDKLLQWDDVTVLGDTPAKLLRKMHQLSSGSVIDEDGNCHLTDPSKVIHLLDRFRGLKKAVFYIYQGERDMLKDLILKCTESPEEFQSSNDMDLVFIGQVRSVREGVRLDTADALIFLNLEWSFLSYEQGRNRLSSKERTTPADVYFLCSDCGIEKEILDAVHGKCDFTYSFFKAKSSLYNGFRK